MEIEFLRDKLIECGVELSLVEGYAKGGEGAIDIANKLEKLVNQEEKFNYMYDLDDSVCDKIKKIANKIYYAKDVVYSDEALIQIKQIEKLGYGNLPICIAKTQYSLSDNPKNLECNDEYNITVRNVELKSGV